MSASDGDDGGGIWPIPIGPGSGTAATVTKQFSSRTASFLRRFASDPVGFIFSAISLYILNGIFDILGVLVASVLAAFDYVVAFLSGIQSYLVRFFAFIGVDILAFLAGLQMGVLNAVRGLGPLGPVVAVGGAAVGIYLLYLGGRFVLRLVIPT